LCFPLASLSTVGNIIHTAKESVNDLSLNQKHKKNEITAKRV